MEPNHLPFANVRQRGYAVKLDSLIGTGTHMGSEVAIAMQKLAADKPNTETLIGISAAQREHSAVDMQTAIKEIASLKAQISGVEAAVTLIRSSAASPANSRRSPTHGGAALQQQQQADKPNSTVRQGHSNSKSPQPGSLSPSMRLPLHLERPAVSGGKLVGSKPASPFARGAADATDDSSPHASSRRSPVPSGSDPLSTLGLCSSTAATTENASYRTTQVVPVSSNTIAGSPEMEFITGNTRQQSTVHSCSSMAPASSVGEAEMEAIIKDPVSHLLRQSLNILGAQQRQHQVCAAKESSSTATVPVVPVTRNEALQLECRVQDSLPAGAIQAMQQQHTAGWIKQQQQHWKQQLALQPEVLLVYQQLLPGPHQQGVQEATSSWQQCDVISQQLMPFYQVMDSLLRETAQQVAYHCVEHGRILDHLRDRFSELANALHLSISSTDQQLTATSEALSAAVTAATAAQNKACSLQRQLTTQQAETERLRSELATVQLKHEQLASESQSDIQQLNHQVLGLRQQLWQVRDEGEAQQAAAESAAAAARQEAEGKLAAAEETKESLLQRLSFINAQLLALRQQQKPPVHTVDDSTQTDIPPPPSADSDSSSEGLLSESSSESELPEEEDEEPVIRTHKKVVDLMKYVSRGQVRSRLWVVKVIGQLYADKAVADAAADAQGQQRSGIAAFTVKWHLNRYGLRHLSLEALSDLMASTCQYAAAGSRPATWFAHFCGTAAAVPKLVPQDSQQEHCSTANTTTPTGAAATEPHQYSRPSSPPVAVEDGESDGSMCLQSSVPPTATSPTVAAAAPAEEGAPEPEPAAAAAAAVTLDLELLLATPAALDFYLFCCCQLAYPNSVMALFPEGEEALPLVRSSLVMETLKAVFRYLGDSDGQALFVAQRLDSAAVVAAPTTDSAAAAVGSKPSTSRKDLLGGKLSAVAGSLRLNPADSSSSNIAGVMTGRGLAFQHTVNIRAAAADGTVGSSGSSSRCERGSTASSSTAGSSIVGGFGYYSAWTLLDLFMSEWVERVAANGRRMAELRRTMACLQPSLYAQVTAAASAAADKPVLLGRLQDAKSALDQLLKPPQAAAAAAAQLAHRRLGQGSSSSGNENEGCAGHAGNATVQNRRDELQPHLLVADATMVNATAALQTYQGLMMHIQAIQDRALRPPSPLKAEQAAAAETETAAAILTEADTDGLLDSPPATADAALAEFQAAGQQGVMLSDALQQQLKKLGLDMTPSVGITDVDDDDRKCAAQASNAEAAVAAPAAVLSSMGASVMREVLTPGGMANALQLARAKRAAAAAAAAGSQPGGV